MSFFFYIFHTIKTYKSLGITPLSSPAKTWKACLIVSSGSVPVIKQNSTIASHFFEFLKPAHYPFNLSHNYDYIIIFVKKLFLGSTRYYLQIIKAKLEYQAKLFTKVF